MIYPDLGNFKSHLHAVHHFLDESEQLWNAIDTCEVSSALVEQRSECPLCRANFSPPKCLQKHLAEHLEELALFATISAGGQDDEHQDLELLEDSSMGSDAGQHSIIESIPESSLSLRQAQRMNVQKYFEVMSQFSIEVPGDTHRYDENVLLENTGAEPQFPIFAILHTPNEFFYGRDHSVEAIHSTLRKPAQILAIIGIGGVGKTELAVQYAYRFKEEFDCVFWIQADTDPGLVESFCQIATCLELLNGTEDQMQIIELGREWLANTGMELSRAIISHAD